MTHPGELLKRGNLYAGKELGQNFLSNPATAQMIVDRTGINRETFVLEIGPGLGALTVPLAKSAARVVAVEKDRRLIPYLEAELAEAGVENVSIINANILKTDIAEIAGENRLTVMGNLPYNISSQILFQLVKTRSVVDAAFLMFQKELAVRLMAAPGGRDFSRLSAVVQYAARISHLAEIRPNSFFPRPDVDSTVLRFDFFDDQGLGPEEEDLLFAVIKAAFSKRRKTLKNAMSGGELGLKKPVAGEILEAAGIDPVRRAETLSIKEFTALGEAAWRILKE
ncbi:MAG: 16S rRNA (adenine(1518)-N(6)/adenine(1519)-N(6))-dimethyltransferase RsmA [Desulfobacterales bacterium]|nr:16S rRNA (adenine(1518)-N(6)/adenine(1519)-N(6))-dimethyltransferase RsmA [Desulfobacterales bacterium]